MERPIFHAEVPDAATVGRYFDELCAAYPFVSTVAVGQTLLGAPLRAAVIGSGKTEILYLGAHRGTDGAATLALIHFLYELCEAVAVGRKIAGRDVRYLVASKRLVVLPLVNADGASLVWHGVDAMNPLRERLLRMNGGSGDFSGWNANARGVDLDCNYAAGWEEARRAEGEESRAEGSIRAAQENGSAQRESRGAKFAGTAPESEPEIAAVAGYLRTVAPHSMLVLRQGSGKIRYAALDGAPTGARQVASALAAATGYKLAAPSGTAAHGSPLEFFLTTYRRPAFQFECGAERTNPEEGRAPAGNPDTAARFAAPPAGNIDTAARLAAVAAEEASTYLHVRKALFALPTMV